MTVAERIRAAAGPSAASTDAVDRPTAQSGGASAVERALGTGSGTASDRLTALRREAEARRSELDADLEEVRDAAEAVAAGVTPDAAVAAGDAPVAVAAARRAVPPPPPPPPPPPVQLQANPYAGGQSQQPPHDVQSRVQQPYTGGPPQQTYAGTRSVGATTTEALSTAPATGALVLAVLGVVLGLAGGFIGVVLGGIALRLAHGVRTRARAVGLPVPGTVTGATVAGIAAIVVGLIVTIGRASS